MRSTLSFPRKNQVTARILAQLKRLRATLLLVYVPGLAVLATVKLISLKKQIPLRMFLSDPASIMQAPLWVGIVSNLGILFWSATAAICLFAAARLRKQKGEREPYAFFLFAGVLTTVLDLDDLLQFHEWIAPKRLHVPELAMYAAYALVTLYFLIRFRNLIFKTEFLLLLFALAAFSMHNGIDSWFKEIRAERLLKEGNKLLGILTWFAYFSRAAYQALAGRFSEPLSAPRRDVCASGSWREDEVEPSPVPSHTLDA